jgi:hypothetical protein
MANKDEIKAGQPHTLPVVQFDKGKKELYYYGEDGKRIVVEKPEGFEYNEEGVLEAKTAEVKAQQVPHISPGEPITGPPSKEKVPGDVAPEAAPEEAPKAITTEKAKVTNE